MGTQFDMNNFNAMISQASDAILCNSECKKQRQSETLQQNLFDAQINLKTSSNQVQVAEKNYVTFTQGTSAYNELIENQLQQKAELITDRFLQNFNDESIQINTQINTYGGLLINFRNVLDLFKKYLVENAKLKKELKDESNDVLINERKTYYEDQNISNLEKIYFYFFLVIYIIFIISFGVFSIIFPSQSSWKVRLAIFIVLIVLPFFSTWILSIVIFLFYEGYNLLPKNVYAQNNY